MEQYLARINESLERIAESLATIEDMLRHRDERRDEYLALARRVAREKLDMEID